MRMTTTGGDLESARTIHAAGIDFHARQSGARPRALFLHGFGGDLRTWDALWRVLGNDLSALRYDLRGFGQSIDSSAVAFNHADDLLALVDVLQIERCDLIGVSMGGAIALHFALEHAQRVHKLILISPGIVGWDWTSAWRARWKMIVDAAQAGNMDAARHLWWQHSLFEPTRASAAGSALLESIERYSGAQWIRDYQRPMLPDIERLHMLSVPTLLLTGGRDVEDFRMIANLIEGATCAKRIDWPDRGHLLQLENPAGCAREILGFLNSAD